MASAPRITRFTPEEYLAMERKAEFKSQYDGGYITAMAGASAAHNFIAGNFYFQIRTQLKGRPCIAFTSDIRLCVDKTGLYTYPDGMALCGAPEYSDANVDTLLNPSLIVEVLSESTESYDRGRKFRHYQQISSLKEYVLVSQDEIRVERYTRRGDDWLLSVFSKLSDSLHLTSINCEILLSDIYENVKVPDKPAGV